MPNEAKLLEHTDQVQELVKDTNPSKKINVSIKDFAYTVPDPRHFGIYNYDDDNEGDEEADQEEEDIEEEDYNNEIEEDENSHYDYYDGFRYEIDTTKKNLEDLPEGEGPDDKVRYITKGKCESGNDQQLVHAIALYSFEPENENELQLSPEQLIIINYQCGDGWLVAHDPFTGMTGLVPSEYIKVVSVGELHSLGYNIEEEDYEESVLDAEDVKGAQRFMPGLLGTDEEEDKADKICY